MVGWYGKKYTSHHQYCSPCAQSPFAPTWLWFVILQGWWLWPFVTDFSLKKPMHLSRPLWKDNQTGIFPSLVGVFLSSHRQVHPPSSWHERWTGLDNPDKKHHFFSFFGLPNKSTTQKINWIYLPKTAGFFELTYRFWCKKKPQKNRHVGMGNSTLSWR